MRNLKRALSLALAAVMVIGMMVIGAGATGFNDFPDKSEIKNQDAVSLLSTLGIINGKDSGKFDPTGNVTRAEMAKMLSVVMNSGADNNALYADMTTKLTDISTSWAKGHINFCYSRNIITGRGNNTFDPTANVTAAEAAKMLLVAAGYNPTTEGFVGSNWSINVSAQASKLGIFKNFENGKLMQPLSRDDAALLIYNAMDIEMIEKYENGYALVHSDSRTILSTMYGVYKVEGVVTSNEWAVLVDTNADAALSKDKTTLENVKVYASTTSNTTNQEYEVEKLPQTFKVSTSVDMLGKTVYMYVRKTTVLSNSEVLGVYVKDGANTVKTITETKDDMKDALKGSGISVDKDTRYYVNYGYMASEAAAVAAMFKSTATDDRFSSVTGKTNAYGVNMDVIDNNGDGVADYILYTQETLTQVTSVNATKETTTLNGFNKNGSIDNVDIVVADEYKEGDLVLANEYGGRFYISAPETITGKMDSFSSSKVKQQYIEINGEKKYPSYINYKADAADNTNEFNVLQCGTVDGVDFDINYDFVLDTLGNVIAFQPSEKGVGNYALILDSGYNPGYTSSNPSGEVKVLLADGTEANYNLNFGASAANIGKQLHGDKTTSASVQKDAGIVELKALLGSSVTDNTTTKPDGATAPSGLTYKYAGKPITEYKAGHAKGYVVEYGLNDEKVMTIKSIVGSNNTGVSHFNPTTAVASKLSTAYENGSARIKYDSTKQLAVDQNTVAFYYVPAAGGVSAKYGVAVGYSKMSNVDNNTDFVAKTTKTANLVNAVVFNAEGVAAEKDYVFVLSRTTSTSGYVTLNVILADGTASTLKLERSHFDTIFTSESDYATAYSYSTNGKGISELARSDGHVKYGYAVKLNNGTVALYSDKACTAANLIDSYSYDKNIWNVEDVSAGDNAVPGAFSTSRASARETILVLDSKNNIVRSAYILSVVDGTVTPPTTPGSMKDDTISTSNTVMVNDISNKTITLNTAMAASTSGSGTTGDPYVTTANSSITSAVFASNFVGLATDIKVLGVYTYNSALGIYSKNADGNAVTSAMFLGVQNPNLTMTYYAIKFVALELPVITTNLPATGAIAQVLSITMKTPTNGALSYQWHKIAKTGSADTTVGTNAATFDTTGSADGDKFYVVVTNTFAGLTTTVTSSTCTIATAVDAETPAFAAGGDLKTAAVVNTELKVTVTPVTDGGTLSYQWYRQANGAATASAITGATAATYTPTTAGVGDKYYVVVTNTNNTVNGTKVVSTSSDICTTEAGFTVTYDDTKVSVKDGNIVIASGSKVVGGDLTIAVVTGKGTGVIAGAGTADVVGTYTVSANVEFFAAAQITAPSNGFGGTFGTADQGTDITAGTTYVAVGSTVFVTASADNKTPVAANLKTTPVTTAGVAAKGSVSFSMTADDVSATEFTEV